MATRGLDIGVRPLEDLLGFEMHTAAPVILWNRGAMGNSFREEPDYEGSAAAPCIRTPTRESYAFYLHGEPGNDWLGADKQLIVPRCSVNDIFSGRQFVGFDRHGGESLCSAALLDNERWLLAVQHRYAQHKPRDLQSSSDITILRVQHAGNLVFPGQLSVRHLKEALGFHHLAPDAPDFADKVRLYNASR